MRLSNFNIQPDDKRFRHTHVLSVRNRTPTNTQKLPPTAGPGLLIVQHIR